MIAPADASRPLTSSVLSKHLHGIDVVIQGPAAILQALGARLQYLPEVAIKASENQLRFTYAEARDGNLCLRPQGVGRPFYQPDHGEASYWSDQDTCFLQLRNGARSICHPAKGTCVTCHAVSFNDSVWQAAHPLFTLPLLEMLRRRNLFFVHAASLAFGSQCLLLAGASGSGKSTLTLALLQAGAAYMGDDLALIDGEAAAGSLSLPEPLSATRRTLEFFAEHEQWTLDPRPAGWPKYEIAPHSVGKVPFCSAATPGALVFPQVAHTRGTAISFIHPDEAFQRLAANLLLTEHRCTKAHAAALAALARSTPAYRMATGTDLTEAAGRLRDLLP